MPPPTTINITTTTTITTTNYNYTVIGKLKLNEYWYRTFHLKWEKAMPTKTLVKEKIQQMQAQKKFCTLIMLMQSLDMISSWHVHTKADTQKVLLASQITALILFSKAQSQNVLRRFAFITFFFWDCILCCKNIIEKHFDSLQICVHWTAWWNDFTKFTFGMSNLWQFVLIDVDLNWNQRNGKMSIQWILQSLIGARFMYRQDPSSGDYTASNCELLKFSAQTGISEHEELFQLNREAFLMQFKLYFSYFQYIYSQCATFILFLHYSLH